MTRRVVGVVLMACLAVVAMGASAKCYPAGTRVVVFVQGLYTSYDEDESLFSVGVRFGL